MEKVVKIGSQEVRLNNNIGWTMEYRDQFGKDIIPAIMPAIAALLEGVSAIVANSDGEVTFKDIAEQIEGRAMDIVLPLFQIEFVDVIINITWALAKCADENILPPRQWVRQFDDFYLDDVIPAVYELVINGFMSAKNRERLGAIGTKSLRPLHSTTSHSQDLSED